MSSGIYRIFNAIDGRIYIGSTNNFAKRKREHFSALKNGTHKNQFLQRAFNKYGLSVFSFEIIEICSVDNLIAREQYWIDLAQTEESCLYNLEKTASRTSLIKSRKYWLGKKRSLKDKQKFSESHIGILYPKRIDNNTGHPDISWNKLNNNYRARITINHRTFNLGHFKNLHDAVSARKHAELTFPGIKREVVSSR